MAELNPVAGALTIEHIDLSFGGAHVLRDVSFDVRSGEILALIGPNGAGKSSLLNIITGVYRPNAGSVTLHCGGITTSLRDVPPHDLVRHGLARTFQNLQLVPELTALDNLLVGRHWLMRSGFLASMAHLGRTRREEAQHARVCRDTLDFLGLGAYAERAVGTLPYGLQKRVELARALAAKPKVLLLDEPAAGLNDDETEEMAGVMRLIRDSGTCTQILVEHDMNMVMSTADRLVVLNFGQVLTSGTAAEVKRHPEVMSAYLGTSLPDQSSDPA